MGKVAKVWSMLVLPLAGVGLVFVYPPVGMGVGLLGAVMVFFAMFELNVPATRAAAVIAITAGGAAVYLATGSPLLAVSVMPPLLLFIPNEIVLRNSRDAHDYAPLVGALAGIVLAGLAYPTLSSPLWLIGPALVFLLNIMFTMGVLKGRKEYLTLMPKSKVQVGKPLPVDVALPARDGQKSFSLAEHIGQFVLLVFIRGDWCPVCHVMLRIVSKERETLSRHGVRIAIISPTEGQMEDEAVQQLGLDPGMLWDENSSLASSLDLIATGEREGKPVPMPVTILIDKEGNVRHLSKPDDVTAYTNERKVISILEAAPA